MNLRLINSLFLFIVIMSLTSCHSPAGNRTITIGINESDQMIWDFVAKKAREKGLNLSLATFSDYAEADLALAGGDLDANAFQTVSYFKSLPPNVKKKLAPLGTTYAASIGVYSKQYKQLEDIPDGAVIAVPDEAAAFGRALFLMQEAGLITLKKGFNGTGSADMIKDNPKRLILKTETEKNAFQAAEHADAAVLSQSDAKKAGFHAEKDALIRSAQLKEAYIHLIAVRAEDKDDERMQTLLSLYQSDDTAAFIEKEYQGSLVPVFLPGSSVLTEKKE
ncbi:MetQ/NlpA family ABC transporter substrate-binding protein [Bacillus sp. L381]|uniref:MetQ/NlpA family ABC transporter substrate-binding protein n=1 Tax=Bacillus TaxID=1386 RepID=UPI001BA8A0C7|nr:MULTISPECIES: MetQ/NlpA family ABC transporter substrate-binding protein [Bacillus]MCR9037482.1 MetQ/NlpA family ABC transporter substrate-binding protein [Bacillus velezensis]QUN10409.1 MetQ/NlpA family ABC transporter substrate-binding protein [Bacillus amyloliquefaciens]QYM83542.1 MetQ/NlpA family ABC transporter substrate-binding protein [Bacillus sp. 7D3]QZY12725.1 MetQ/NlpA family ABC transporter substrate-binding protein [Bacillus amyloliquefaciens]WIX22538.1 MetQ/NlpA family ABC tra